LTERATSTAPLVSVALPVYNGERYVRRAIESLLAQTLSDLELIVTDNASTDGTGRIVEEIAASDSRVRYQRNPENIGAARNFNLGYALARGRYFKWAAHDDECRPAFLERCVEALEARPDALLAYPQQVEIDERGNPGPLRPCRFDCRADGSLARWRSMLGVRRGAPQIFGVFRTSALRGSALIGSYDQSDLVLLARLALAGRFVEVPEPLLLHREHDQRSVQQHESRRGAAVWFDPTNAGRILMPEWRLLWEYGKCAADADMPLADRLRAMSHLARVGWWGGAPRKLAAELLAAAVQAVSRPLRIVRRPRSRTVR